MNLRAGHSGRTDLDLSKAIELVEFQDSVDLAASLEFVPVRHPVGERGRGDA